MNKMKDRGTRHIETSGTAIYHCGNIVVMLPGCSKRPMDINTNETTIG